MAVQGSCPHSAHASAPSPERPWATWAAGPGSAPDFSDAVMEGLDGQLREQTAGARKSAVAELVRTGHVSAALQVVPVAAPSPAASC